MDISFIKAGKIYTGHHPDGRLFIFMSRKDSSRSYKYRILSDGAYNEDCSFSDRISNIRISTELEKQYLLYNIGKNIDSGMRESLSTWKFCRGHLDFLPLPSEGYFKIDSIEEVDTIIEALKQSGRENIVSHYIPNKHIGIAFNAKHFYYIRHRSSKKLLNFNDYFFIQKDKEEFLFNN